MRLLTAVAALGQGTFTLTGTDRMAERPIQDLIDALEQLDVRIRSKHRNGCPPVEIIGEKMSGGSVTHQLPNEQSISFRFAFDRSLYRQGIGNPGY